MSNENTPMIYRLADYLRAKDVRMYSNSKVKNSKEIITINSNGIEYNLNTHNIALFNHIRIVCGIAATDYKIDLGNKSINFYKRLPGGIRSFVTLSVFEARTTRDSDLFWITINLTFNPPDIFMPDNQDFEKLIETPPQ
jgi:hypothetical protein